MNSNEYNNSNAPRGRPRTLNRDHVLDVAMQAYWHDGVDNVSVNEICKKANVAKPGLYREFTNEDGLMKAALQSYQKKILAPLFEALKADAPFRETLGYIVASITMENHDEQAPKGCLMAKMRQSRSYMGAGTQAEISHIHEQVLDALHDWVLRSKTKGEFTADLPPKLAATYVDAQMHCAMLQLAQGEENKTVKEVLTLSFSVLL
ncbi:TetR/AcrR family transcriptional regulator [Oceanospirillaceae bacterium]|jgi:AcrR family transcriptional regulator|nr:TetR/AcrR family transcriptional regulator [Oceanospirillaceae bacterium]|tara:strand:- start:104 stop:721 length:618 start_codon:yes stop_codon:yes gene_type:complete